MSTASERKAMREILPAYALMGTKAIGLFLGCTPDVARDMLEDGTIPSVLVGKRRHADPVDVVVHVLAAREGVTAEAFWQEHGEQTVELAKRYLSRVRRMIA